MARCTFTQAGQGRKALAAPQHLRPCADSIMAWRAQLLQTYNAMIPLTASRESCTLCSVCCTQIRISFLSDLAPETAAAVHALAADGSDCQGCRFYRNEAAPPKGSLAHHMASYRQNSRPSRRSRASNICGPNWTNVTAHATSSLGERQGAHSRLECCVLLHDPTRAQTGHLRDV